MYFVLVVVLVSLSFIPSVSQDTSCGFDSLGQCPCIQIDIPDCVIPTSDPSLCTLEECSAYACICLDSETIDSELCQANSSFLTFSFSNPGDPSDPKPCSNSITTRPVPLSSTPAPTPASSPAPTPAATAAPSPAPTPAPSLAPTSIPSPTPAPSPSPSLAPPQPATLRQVFSLNNGGFTDVAQTGIPGDSRIFVVRQNGIILLLNSDYSILNQEFLSVAVSGAGEGGLLSMTFHPSYATNGFFFVNYMRPDNRASVVARYSVDPLDPNSALPSSFKLILQTPQPFSNHNSNAIRFNPPSSELYIAFGDGGSANDPRCNAQNLENVLGTIARIDIDVPTEDDDSVPYLIPESNPFFGMDGIAQEIFVYGLRNPYRLSFDSQGDLYLVDVGQNAREEINIVRAGESGMNFGWVTKEGTLCNSNARPCNSVNDGCDSDLYVDPIYEYSHSDGCSIAGGAVYEKGDVAELQGSFIFSDFCTSVIWMLVQTENGYERMDVPFVDPDQIQSNIVFVTTTEGGPFFVGARDQLFVIEPAQMI